MIKKIQKGLRRPVNCVKATVRKKLAWHPQLRTVASHLTFGIVPRDVLWRLDSSCIVAEADKLCGGLPAADKVELKCEVDELPQLEFSDDKCSELEFRVGRDILIVSLRLFETEGYGYADEAEKRPKAGQIICDLIFLPFGSLALSEESVVD